MNIRVIAFYLPQFYPTPENDRYWGKGFTEWTNVALARPLFRGHYQPQIPADLGFYDLRVPEIRDEQADYARRAGIEGFCYWHYWFGNGKVTLQRTFREVLESGNPDYPFCLGWANHDWTTKTWNHGNRLSEDQMIFKQEYPGDDDIVAHFNYVLPAFLDHRYITVDEKPLFYIFDPDSVPDTKRFIKIWNELALKQGLKGIYFVGRYDALPTMSINNYKNLDSLIKPRFEKLIDEGYDGVNSVTLKYAEFKSTGFVHKAIHSFLRKYAGGIILDKYKYKKIMDNVICPADYLEYVYPQITPRRDRSPRSGRQAMIYYDSTPELFKEAVKKAARCVVNRNEQHRILFLNAWNEWGEGDYMEPDQKFKCGYIDALREALDEISGI